MPLIFAIFFTQAVAVVVEGAVAGATAGEEVAAATSTNLNITSRCDPNKNFKSHHCVVLLIVFRLEI